MRFSKQCTFSSWEVVICATPTQEVLGENCHRIRKQNTFELRNLLTNLMFQRRTVAFCFAQCHVQENIELPTSMKLTGEIVAVYHCPRITILDYRSLVLTSLDRGSSPRCFRQVPDSGARMTTSFLDQFSSTLAAESRYRF